MTFEYQYVGVHILRSMVHNCYQSALLDTKELAVVVDVPRLAVKGGPWDFNYRKFLSPR